VKQISISFSSSKIGFIIREIEHVVDIYTISNEKDECVK